MRKFSMRPFVVGMLVLSSAVIPASRADAVGGNCSSRRETKTHTLLPDEYRVRATCTSLQADSKAKGVLDINLDNDFETPWFTTTNTFHYSGWTTCISPFTCNNTYVVVAHR